MKTKSRKNNVARRADRRVNRRRGFSSLEVVMTTAVMLPIAFGIFSVGILMCRAIYNILSTVVTWPFL